MFFSSRLYGVAAGLALLLGAQLAYAARTESDIIAASTASDWRALDPEHTVLMEVRGTQVVLELAPRFAPQHVANIKALVRNGFYDKTAVVRVQDNFVAQWGDPADDIGGTPMPLGDARAQLPAEFSIAYKGLPVQRLGDVDGWAPVTGWVDGMPVAADPAKNRAWIAHCYGVVGAGRGDTVDSSNGSSLYAIIGQAPRRLDLNITVVGRVLQGMEALASLPRGTAAMGFYDKPEQRIPLSKVRLLADVPAAERPSLQIMRTDTATWKAMLHAARHAASSWYVYQAGHTNICNRSVPVRTVPAGASQ